MSMAIDTYLDRVMGCANLRDAARATAVRAELHDHLRQKVADLEAGGMGEADAVFRAMDDLGDPAAVGYSLRPRWPLIDVRLRGTAKGIIAVGPRAVGVCAMGGVTVGVFSFGGVSFGLVSWGGVAMALLWAWGAVAIASGFAMGGAAVGTFASGQAATGVVAAGYAANGTWAAGEVARSSQPLETMPGWMMSIAQVLPMDFTRMMWTLAVLVPVFIALWVISWRMTAGEQRRLLRAGSPMTWDRRRSSWAG